MPKLRGFFDFLPQPDKISPEEIKLFLQVKEDAGFLENELANKIIYSQSVPVTISDLNFNLAVLSQVLKAHGGQYCDQRGNRIIIPEIFLTAVNNLQRLAWLFLNTFRPYGCTALFLKLNRPGFRNLGTYIRPNILSRQGEAAIWLGGQKHPINLDGTTLIPAPTNKVDIKFEADNAELFGKKITALEVIGGPLGLVVDTRRKVDGI